MSRALTIPPVHRCALCGQTAHWGYGRNRKAPLFWTCRLHRGDGERRLSLPVPVVTDTGPAQGALL